MSSIRSGLVAGGAAALCLAFAAPVAAQSLGATAKIAPGGLYEIVFNPVDSTLLVAATGPRGETKGAVAHLKADLTPLALIDVSKTPVFGLGFNAKTQVLYGTVTRNGSVLAIDARTGKVIAEIKDGDDDSAHVREVIVDEQRNKAYVTTVGGQAGDTSRPNLVWVIDGGTNKIERKITTPVGVLTGAALDVAGNRLFVTGMGSHDIGVIDLGKGDAAVAWPTGSKDPANVAYDPAGKRLFVASQGSGDLTVMSSVDGKVISKVATGKGALSVAYDGGIDRVYVANRGEGTTTVVNGKDYAVLANLATGTMPQTIAIDRKTHLVYVTNKAKGLPRNAPAGTPVPEDPTGDTVTIIKP